MIRAAVLVVALLLSPSLAVAQLRAVAVDGDTLRIGDTLVRVMGLDAPEMHGRCPRESNLARAARDRLSELIARGVRIEPHGRDRYGRLLAVVRESHGRDVAAILISEGFARPYDGHGRRAPWC